MKQNILGLSAMNTKKRSVVSFCIASLSSVIVTVLLMVIISAAVTGLGKLPYELMPVFSAASVIAGAFSGGWICAAIRKKEGMLSGAVTGVILMLLLLVGGVAAGNTISYMVLMRIGIAAAAGAVGGVIGVNKRKRRKKF